MLRKLRQTITKSAVLSKAKQKISYVYCNAPGKIWLGRSGFCIIIIQLNCTILAVTMLHQHKLGRVKRICVFEHSVMTNFDCACPAIQMGQGAGFLSEGSS